MGASVMAPGPTVNSSLKFDHPEYDPVVHSSSRGFCCTPAAASAARLSVPAYLDAFPQSSATQSRPMLLKGEQLQQRDKFAGPLLAADSQRQHQVPGMQQAAPGMRYGTAPGTANGSGSASGAPAGSRSNSSSNAQQPSGPFHARHVAGRTTAEHLHSPRVCLYITEVGCATATTRQWPWQASPATWGSVHPGLGLPARSNSMPNLPSTASSQWQPPHAPQGGSLHDQLPDSYRRSYTNCPLAFDPFEGDLALLDSPLVQALMVNAM